MRSISEATSAWVISLAFMGLPERWIGGWSERMYAHRAGRVLDGGPQKASPTKKAHLRRIEDGGDDAQHFTFHVDQRATGIAGLAAASNWIRLLSTRLPSVDRNSRFKPGYHAGRGRGTEAKGKANGKDFVTGTANRQW